MSEPTDELRRAMAQAIMTSPGRTWLDFADAAIAVYRSHPDGAGSWSPASYDAGFRVGLEAAAQKATSFLVGDPVNGVPLRSPMTHEVAKAIRALAPREKGA